MEFDFDQQLEVSHFVLSERKCRVCGKTKDLIDGFYLIRKNKSIQSSYSYECKTCTIAVSYTHLTLPTIALV